MIRPLTELGKSKARRNIYILTSAINGVSFDDIAAEVGLSKDHIKYCCYRLTALMKQPQFLDEPYPRHSWYRIREIQRHKDFWLRRMAKLRIQWKLDDPVKEEEET